MNNSLRIQRDRLALEALSGADIKSLMTTGVPAMLTEIKCFFNQFAPDQPAIKLTGKQQDFVKEIQKHPYLNIAPLTAFVPEGLNVTYANYASHLMMGVMHASRVLSGPLSAYTTFLSQLISNHDQQLSSTSFDKAHKELARERNDINEELGSCFKRGSTKTDVTIGDVIARNSDWPAVFQNSTHILNLMNEVDRKALNKKIAECGDLLDKVMAMSKRGELEGMTPQAMTNLSNGAYQIASELEFFAAMYYKATAYAESLNRTVEHFHTVFKK